MNVDPVPFLEIDRTAPGADDGMRAFSHPDSGSAELDDLVRLAAQVCNAPFASMTVIGPNAIAHKADVGWGRQQDPEFKGIFAGLVIDSVGLVLVEDAHSDAMFRDDPAVTGPLQIRFAAGVPLLFDGRAIGTLCVFDKVPRSLSDEATAALEALARQCVSQVQLRRSLRIEREAEERLRLIFESATDYAIVSLDLNGEIRSWNAGARMIFGWSEAEAKGKPVSILFSAPDRQAGIVERDLAKAMAYGREVDERYYVRKNRSTFWGTGETMPLRSPSGEARGFLKILRDRTTQKRIKEALEYQTNVLQAITDHLAEALFQVDVDQRVTFVNPAAEALFGWSRYELVGVNLHDRLHYHHHDGTLMHRDFCPYAIALKNKTRLVQKSDVFVHRDGHLIDVEASFAPILSGDIVTGAVITLIDVTRAKATEEALRRTQERYQLAVTASGIIGSWDWDLCAKKVVADATFAEQYGVDPTEAAEGKPIEDFIAAIHPEDRERVFAAIDESIASKRQFVGEYRLLRADDTVRWISAHARCHYDADGRPVRYPGLSVDITERKQAEERRAAVLELEDRLRNEENTAQITGRAAQLLCRLLDGIRAGFCTVDATGAYGTIERDFTRPGVASLAGTYKLSDFGAYGEEIRQGSLIAIDDVGLDHRLQAEGARWSALNIASLVNVPLMAEGRLAAVFFVHSDKPHEWMADDVSLISNVADRTWSAISRAQSVKRQKILTGELQHRIKNTMAMVLAIANQTMRKAATKEEAFQAFEDRILALSDAQNILTRASWSSAPMDTIVHGALAPHRPQQGDRIRVRGPAVSLSAQTALSFALALHELATNATKYGALSNETGFISIDWTIAETEGQAMFGCVWQEHDGPEVTAPTHKGFGTRLIKGSFVRTIKITIDYDPAGLICTFSAPLSAL